MRAMLHVQNGRSKHIVVSAIQASHLGRQRANVAGDAVLHQQVVN